MSEAFADIREYTKSSVERLSAMEHCLRKIEKGNIPGDIVECGVWRGGNIILARRVRPERVCWLYDTFTGMTEPCEFDKTRKGRAAKTKYDAKKAAGKGWTESSLEEVVTGLKDTGVYDERKLRFVVGDVCRTLRDPANLPGKIALLRLDTDFYESTKIELEVLWPLLSPGGFLIVDDYGHWLGARRAVNDFFLVRPEMFKIDYTAIMMVKPVC